MKSKPKSKSILMFWFLVAVGIAVLGSDIYRIVVLKQHPYSTVKGE
ncbi:hypothetical protein [Acinetobacter calcoaceticus]|nr:hypothetical protein [Acinetobacter calcoaceticus]ENU07757.1 hypothetical protein F997_03620 [Acinetobacter calcoaceticus NIPH 13]